MHVCKYLDHCREFPISALEFPYSRNYSENCAGKLEKGEGGRQFFLVPNFPRGARGGGEDPLFIFGTFVKICETRTDEASSHSGEEKGKNKNELCFRIGHKKVTILYIFFLFPGDPLHSTA